MFGRSQRHRYAVPQNNMHPGRRLALHLFQQLGIDAELDHVLGRRRARQLRIGDIISIAAQPRRHSVHPQQEIRKAMPGGAQQGTLIDDFHPVEHRLPRRGNPLAQPRLGRDFDNAASLRPQALQERPFVLESLLPQQRQLLVVLGGRHCRVGQLPQVEEGRVAAPQEVDQVRCRVQPDTLFLAHGFFL